MAIGPSRQNLFRVWSIRSILIVVLAALVVGLRHFALVDLPWKALSVVLLAAALANLALLLRLGRPKPVSEPEFFANLFFDVLIVAAVLYLTGGSTNPLVSYFLIPLIISAAVLRPRYTWAIALLTIACYTALLFHYRPLDLFSMAGRGAAMSAHFIGMWINFAFSAFLIAWFVVRMAATTRSQQQAIARVREEGLRNEQIIGAASIAAGTAHELRTPLATMALLSEELAREHPDLAQDLELMQRQVERCEAILHELISATTDSSRRKRINLRALFSAIGGKWALARPEVSVSVSMAPGVEGFELEIDTSFSHALLNFLNNAADASPENVGLSAVRDGESLLIRVEDRGPGVPPDISDALGRRYISHRDGGLGLGVLLSSASIARHGGEVTLHDRPGGGTRLEIRLPTRAGD